LGQSLTNLLNKYMFKNKIVIYAKDKRSNLNALTIVLKSIMNCEVLGLEENFKGIYFGHVFFQSMSTWHNKWNVCRNLKYVSIKFAQVDLQKCINWPKKMGAKARLE